jgi:glycosyltransferase involved in cell wall biosynthesis
MKIGFVSNVNLHDPLEFERAFSGIYASMARAFERAGRPLTLIAPVGRGVVGQAVYLGAKVVKRLSRGRADYRGEFSPLVLSRTGRRAATFANAAGVDVVLGSSTTVLAHFAGDQPYFLWRDANFFDLIDGYGEYRGMSRASVDWARDQEVRAMTRARHCFFSSRCSVESASSFGGIPPQKLEVAPFGANLPETPTEHQVERWIEGRPRDCHRLLMIGIDLERKGGNTAFAACRELQRRQVPFRLDVIGGNITVPSDIAANVRMHGFLHKRKPSDWQRFTEIVGESHLLLHPARAEAFGCALVEAAAFGVPTIGSSVGGLRTIVEPGVTGELLPKDAGASDYADCIERTLVSRERYQAMAFAAYRATVTRLNWDVSVAKVLERINLELKRN